jgi:hypothetical protein
MGSELIKKNTFYWVAAFTWVALIYLSVPCVRGISNQLRDSFLLLPTIYTIFGICIIFLLILFYKHYKFSIFNIVGLIFITGSYCVLLIYSSTPEEKIHLIEYGILAYLFVKAIGFDRRKMYFLAIILTALFGLGDELVQYYTPNRFFDWWDVFLNAVSGFNAVLLIYLFRNRR